ncbi:insulinase family protein [Saccharobesus litoralis]|uniref:insulinase family protein n=1 Tax=Saccharobesus litoralis TaxID=2172099 RepID=UPI00131F1ABD|nr:insulinase family protein [Saccharobesus litoralis]
MITKSPNDTRQYRHIRLQNHLDVVLIHDKQSHKSAASMVVNAGHFDDPKNCLGLAHFIEHMLFLGTESFPEADAYQNYISQHGGHHNAWTGSEHTNFYLDINSDAFAGALERFSQFFICPLFNPEYINKERNAIESEFELKRKDDLRRLYEVHKETSNPEHPFSRFSVGNLQTLVDRPEISLRQQLQQFFDKNYLANRMKLVLAGKQSLDELAELAQRYFDKIKTSGETKPPISSPIYQAEHQQCGIQVQTLREANQIILSFAFEPIQHRYRDKSISYLGYILGREDKGSLFAYLREQGLVNGLSAGSGVDASNFKDFNISIQLTQLGKHNIEQICYVVFAYIKFAQSQPVANYIYHEKQQLAALAFNYQEQTKLLDAVSAIAQKMHYVAIEDLLVSDYLMQGLDTDWLTEHWQKLTPTNMRLIQLSDQTLEQAQISQWYNAPYQHRAFDSELVEVWQQADYQQLPDCNFQMPSPNPYVPERTEPLEVEHDFASINPIKLVDETGLKLWYKQDERFATPKSHIYVSLDMQQAQGSIYNVAMTRLYIEVLLDKIDTDLYHAAAAGMSYHIYPHQAGLTLHISGFADKQQALLGDILSALQINSFSVKRFNEVKRQLQQSWRNSNKGKPVSKLFSRLNALLQNNQYMSVDMAQAIDPITQQDFSHFAQTLFDSVHCEAFIYGDVQMSSAHKIHALLNDFILANKHAIAEVPRNVHLLPQQQCELTCEDDHPDHSLILYYQAADASNFSAALLTLANHIISPAFFHQLRTEKQLGYMLGTGYMPINQQPGFIAYVQSNTTEPQAICQAIDDFFATLPEQLNSMETQHFASLKTNLSQQLLEKDSSLRITAQRFWLAIGLKDHEFNRKQAIAEQVEKIELQQLVEFVTHSLICQANCARLVLSSSPMAHSNNDNSVVVLQNDNHFKEITKSITF